MDPRTRKEILGQWGVRHESDVERIERKKLERDLAGSPLVGKPLPERLRNFRPSLEGHLLSLGGPLPYMVRLREIEARTAEHEHELESAWRELAETHADDPAGFARAWRRLVDRWSFDEVNDLIERHNRFYPIESRLPMDVRRRDFALVNGEHYARRPLDAAWALERFPPELASARERARSRA